MYGVPFVSEHTQPHLFRVKLGVAPTGSAGGTSLDIQHRVDLTFQSITLQQATVYILIKGVAANVFTMIKISCHCCHQWENIKVLFHT